MIELGTKGGRDSQRSHVGQRDQLVLAARLLAPRYERYDSQRARAHGHRTTGGRHNCCEQQMLGDHDVALETMRDRMQQRAIDSYVRTEA